jgi:protein-tyrosine-phosphatase
MAEAILKSKIKKNKIKWWDVSSCGVHAELGGTMSENSRLALEEIGIKNDKFSPRQLTQKIIESSTIVICMTSTQKQMLEDCGNVHCIKDFTGCDVPDPYGQDLNAYRRTRDALIYACELIIDKYIKEYKDQDKN